MVPGSSDIRDHAISDPRADRRKFDQLFRGGERWRKRVDAGRPAATRFRPKYFLHSAYGHGLGIQGRDEQLRCFFRAFRRAEHQHVDASPARINCTARRRGNTGTRSGRRRLTSSGSSIMPRLAAARAAGNTSLVNQILATPEYPKGHSNNFAGTIGGPVVIPKIFNGKNKLFWFFAYDGARDDIPARPSDINDTVPTAPERSGNFSDLLPLGSQYVIYDPLTVQPQSGQRRALHPHAVSRQHRSAEPNHESDVWLLQLADSAAQQQSDQPHAGAADQLSAPDASRTTTTTTRSKTRTTTTSRRRAASTSAGTGAITASSTAT